VEDIGATRLTCVSSKAALASGLVTAALVLLVVWIFEVSLERAGRVFRSDADDGNCVAVFAQHEAPSLLDDHMDGSRRRVRRRCPAGLTAGAGRRIWDPRRIWPLDPLVAPHFERRVVAQTLPIDLDGR